MADIDLIFVNLHHRLNELRPLQVRCVPIECAYVMPIAPTPTRAARQARMALAQLLEQQRAKRELAATCLREKCDQMRTLADQCRRELLDVVRDVDQTVRSNARAGAGEPLSEPRDMCVDPPATPVEGCDARLLLWARTAYRSVRPAQLDDAQGAAVMPPSWPH